MWRQGHVDKNAVLIRNLLRRNKSVINFIYQINRFKCWKIWSRTKPVW